MKNKIFGNVESKQEMMESLAWQVHDYAEISKEEVKSCKLLAESLEKLGFAVETEVFGMPHSFRAVWKNGEGGPNIGFLGEYDALPGVGHGCGHHLQTPAAIGAAAALKESLTADTPCTITVYGTPAEEAGGGKVVMMKNGGFKELDVALACHICRTETYVGADSMACAGFTVDYIGKRSHAASAPHEGRSALDAAILSFNGIEFMREHVKDGSRIHYTMKEGTGASNVVHAAAKVGYTVRSRDNRYLDELVGRFHKIVQGACLMTETEAEIDARPRYLARIPNDTIAQVVKANYEAIGEDILPGLTRGSGGSTDFGNVSTIVPAALMYMHFVDVTGHSQEMHDMGKSEEAKGFLQRAAKAFAGTAYDLICSPETVKKAREELNSK